MSTITKKLVHFAKKEDFTTRNDNGDILDTSIVFVKDSNEIYTHGAEYQWVAGSKLGSENFYTSEGSVFSASDGAFYVKL